MDPWVSGGLFTALSAIIVAIIHQGSKGIRDRLDRIEDKLDDHIQWHLPSRQAFRRNLDK